MKTKERRREGGGDGDLAFGKVHLSWATNGV